MLKGVDYLGGANYIDNICKYHPEGWAAGFLCKASGWDNGIKAARALAETGKCPVMRIHGLWRDDHKFTKTQIYPAVEQARKVAKLARDFPGIKLFFSPILEHMIAQRLFKRFARACREVLPRRVRIVCSGQALPYGINEVHHNLHRHNKYIYSYDGLDMLNITAKDRLAYKRWHSQAKIYFAWISRCNGKIYTCEDMSRKERVKRGEWLRRKDFMAIVEAM